LDEYCIVRQSRQVAVFVVIAKAGLHMQEMPLLTGIFRGSWHMQTPKLVDAVNTQIRAEGH
jgi:hypothetical protein